MDRFISTGGPLFERRWTDVTEITMAALAIVKALDVLEHIGSGFLASSVTHSIHSLTL
jgi:hypothetical protein